jgi:hypothetical protein
MPIAWRTKTVAHSRIRLWGVTVQNLQRGVGHDASLLGEWDAGLSSFSWLWADEQD